MVKIGRREESVCVLPEARRKKRGMTVGKVRKERERRKERKIGSRFEIGHGRRRTGHGFGCGITSD